LAPAPLWPAFAKVASFGSVPVQKGSIGPFLHAGSGSAFPPLQTAQMPFRRMQHFAAMVLAGLIWRETFKTHAVQNMGSDALHRMPLQG